MSLIYKALQRSRRRNPLLPDTESGPVVRKKCHHLAQFSFISLGGIICRGITVFAGCAFGALSSTSPLPGRRRLHPMCRRLFRPPIGFHRLEEPPADRAGQEPVSVPADAGAAVQGRQPEPVKSPFRFYPAQSSSARPMSLEQPAGGADPKTTDRAAALFFTGIR